MTPTALIADADPAAADASAAALRRAGLRPLIAPDAVSAEAVLTSEPVAVVVCSAEFPGRDAPDLVELSKRADPKRPVVVVAPDGAPLRHAEYLRNRADLILYGPDRSATAAAAQSLADRAASRERVLAIGALPGDVPFGAGGTLQRHAAAGDEVRILALDAQSYAGAVQARRSAALLGVDVDIDFVDLTDPEAVARRIAAAVEGFQPTVVYTHSASEDCELRRGVHAATVACVDPRASVRSYQTRRAAGFTPVAFVDVTPHLDNKLAALSQLPKPWHNDRLSFEAGARHAAKAWSRFAAGDYAEPFEVVSGSGPFSHREPEAVAA